MRRTIWLELSELAGHINSHQRVTSGERRVLLSGWARWSVRWISVNSLQESIITQWAREQNGHGGKEGGYAWVQPIRRSLMKADLARLRAKCPSTNCRVQQWAPQHGTGTCSHSLGQTFIYSGYGFAFPARSASARTAICGLTDA